MKSNHELHKELWFWLAENPDKGKNSWPGWGKLPCNAYKCFACAQTETKFGIDCDICPLDWEVEDDGFYCEHDGSIFVAWGSSKHDLEKRSIMAEVIATKTWHKRRNK